MAGRRRLSESELALWRRATADVRPLDTPPPEAADETRERPPSPNADRPSATDQVNGRPAPPVAPKAPRPLDPAGPVDMDRKSWERLKRGRVEIERSLDLHGMTQTEAHRALNGFLAMAAATGLRCVLVVTGKGGSDRHGEGRGVLRQMVPRWLGEPGNREKVLTYSPAQRRHGGDGALYVLLRRRRGNGRR